MVRRAVAVVRGTLPRLRPVFIQLDKTVSGSGARGRADCSVSRRLVGTRVGWFLVKVVLVLVVSERVVVRGSCNRQSGSINQRRDSHEDTRHASLRHRRTARATGAAAPAVPAHAPRPLLTT